MRRKRIIVWVAARRAANRGSVNIRAIARRKQAKTLLASVFGLCAALCITALLALPHLLREPIEVTAALTEPPAAVPTAVPTAVPMAEPQPDTAKDTAEKDALLVLVNGEHAIPETFSLVTRSYGGVEVNALMYTDLCKMLDDAAKAGHTLWVASGYRSVDAQQSILEKAVQNRMANGMTEEAAYKDARRTIQTPGHSEHHTGLAVDLGLYDTASGIYDDFDGTGDYVWFADNAADYGFILRYPKGYEDVTGYDFEPWHYRYIGVDAALEFRDTGCVTLEEYSADKTM